MSEAETEASQPDPIEKMRELRDACLDTWSKYLIEIVNYGSLCQGFRRSAEQLSERCGAAQGARGTGPAANA